MSVCQFTMLYPTETASYCSMSLFEERKSMQNDCKTLWAGRASSKVETRRKGSLSSPTASSPDMAQAQEMLRLGRVQVWLCPTETAAP